MIVFDVQKALDKISPERQQTSISTNKCFIIAGALALCPSHTTEAYDLWERVTDSDDWLNSSWLQRSTVHLARALLRSCDDGADCLDQFHRVIRHTSFHKDYCYLRHKARFKALQLQMDAVYVDYIGYCRRNLVHLEHAESLYGMKDLFQSFSDAFYCGNGPVERQIKAFFTDTVAGRLGKESPWVFKEGRYCMCTHNCTSHSMYIQVYYSAIGPSSPNLVHHNSGKIL